MRLLILLMGCLLGVTLGSNRIECDANAAMDKGCWLSDYTGSWHTVKCAQGFTLTTSLTCVPDCQDGEFLFGPSCRACADNCDACFGEHPFQCSVCADSHELNPRRICSLKCGVANEFGSPGAGTCSVCHESCASCFHSSETACTACSTSDSLSVFPYAQSRSESGYCKKNLASENANFFRQYPADRVISECPSGCTRCNDRFHCTACAAGFHLHPPADSGAGYALCVSNSS